MVLRRYDAVQIKQFYPERYQRTWAGECRRTLGKWVMPHLDAYDVIGLNSDWRESGIRPVRHAVPVYGDRQ